MRVASHTLALLSIGLTTVFSAMAWADDAKQITDGKWRPLFDGKTLDGWKISQFGGEGEVYVEDKQLMFDFGSSLTGVTYKGKAPQSNYEIKLEAKRLDGTDFFCGLTFPVGQSHCSLIVGGWGGALVGLSSIDGFDASENDTTQSMSFKRGQWYRIKVRVEDQRIAVWIDDKQIIDQDIEGRQISIRPEVELSRPLGLCAWETRAAMRQPHDPLDHSNEGQVDEGLLTIPLQPVHAGQTA